MELDWFHRFGYIYDLIRPVLDIGILAFLLYKVYVFLVKTQAMQLVRGAGFLTLVYGVAYLFRLTTLQWILQTLGPGFFVVIAIVFQPELRKIIMRLGQGDIFRPDTKPRIGKLDAVITAAEILSQERRGALVVFSRKTNIRNIIDTGTRMNAEISSPLIVAVFEFDGPLHDGAMVIQNGHIAAAGCFLPLSDQQGIRKSFGTRHRAALGMSEQSDAVILVVSEETGALSLAFDSKIYYDLSTLEITRRLKELLDRGARRESFDASPKELGGGFGSAAESSLGLDLGPNLGAGSGELAPKENADVFAKP
ncbi:MAG: diadenylate cyclase CdaA [Treponema sp.]|jgi:diadenylate cyclase|nr:diadenylate cyclase CdaA [Treponema sp.]